MESWKEDQLHVLLRSETEQELHQILGTFVKKLGFEHYAYRIQLPVPISRPIVSLSNNYPEKWQRHYQERGYIAIDPTVKHGLCSNRSVIWTDNLFSSTPELWEEAQAHGLRFGWTKASRDANGLVGILTLTRSAKPITENELFVNMLKWTWLVDCAHEGMSKLLIPKHAPEILAKITEREREILLWTAEGKTAYEIGQILHISENTALFHTKNVIRKLGAANKTQAAVKAAVLGLL